MKLSLWIFFSVIMLTLLFISAFFFWGSGSKFPPDSYSTIHKHESTEPTRNAPDSSYTIVTYNIGYMSGMINNTTAKREPDFFQQNIDHASKILGQLNIDILATQETDYASARSFDKNQEVILSQALHLPYTARTITWDKRHVPFPEFPLSAHFGRMLSGQSLLSRYPIIDNERLELDKVDSNPFWYNAFYLDRVAQVATIRLGETEVKIIHVHLEAFDATTREKQLKKVAKLYETYSSSSPTILLGDFNTDPDEEKMLSQYILSLPNIKSALDDYTEGTYPADDPKQKIDYIFYSPSSIHGIEARIVHEAATASDHLPVMLRFGFKSTNPS